MLTQPRHDATAHPRRRSRPAGGWRGCGPLTLFAMLLVALSACGGAATATVAPQPSPSAAPSPAAQASTAQSPAASPAPSSSASAASAAASATPRPTAATTGGTPAAGAAASTGASAGAQRYTIVSNTSKATYTVQETFVGRGLATAVGSTNGLTGAILIDKGKPSASSIEKITIDISKLVSDSNQRDNRIRREWLESDKYPNATFVAKRLAGLPDTPYTDGQELTFTVVGDLTIRTVTREVTFEARGKIVGDTYTGTATTNFAMTDFGFNPPEVAGLLKAENAVKLDLTIEAKR